MDLILCIRSGYGFEEGEWYPIVGYNDGLHIANTKSYKDNGSNTVDVFYCVTTGPCITETADDDGTPNGKALFLNKFYSIKSANADDDFEIKVVRSF